VVTQSTSEDNGWQLTVYIVFKLGHNVPLPVSAKPKTVCLGVLAAKVPTKSTQEQNIRPCFAQSNDIMAAFTAWGLAGRESDVISGSRLRVSAEYHCIVNMDKIFNHDIVIVRLVTLHTEPSDQL